MRRVCIALTLVALTAGCSQRPADSVGATAVVAGASVEPAPDVTTTVPPTTVPTTTVAAPATTASPPITARWPGPPLPTTTPTTAPRPTTTSTTVHPPAATVNAHGATVTLKTEPHVGSPGFKFTVDVTTADLQYIELVKFDFGNGRTWEYPPVDPGPLCSLQPRRVTQWTHMNWPAPGTYRVRATVIIVPCWPATGPPGSPPGAPLPDAPRQPVEVSLTVTEP